MRNLIKKATLVAIILGAVSSASASYYYSPIDPAGNLTRSLMYDVYGGVGYRFYHPKTSDNFLKFLI